MRSALAATLGVCVCLSGQIAVANPPLEWMLELTVHGQRIEGAAVAWNSREVLLMGRDGRIWQFAPEEATQYRKSSSRFSGYSPSELRAMLLRELGDGFEVSGTGHYMVAHPAGEQDRWADRFEDLYREFIRYFSVRGFRLQQPPIPLIGIVCRNREQFARYAARGGTPAGKGLAGYYSTQTNRIVLYDAGGGRGTAGAAGHNAATVIHEATHQVAFNTGIHSRYAQAPLWVAEGLATMFEGVLGASGPSDGPRRTRANRLRLRDFRENVGPALRPGQLADLVASDRMFRADPARAYAQAWALTFYLVETQPGRYAEYLGRTAARPAFERYPAEQRTADFAAVFGDDWSMLEARLLRFAEELK